MTALAGLLARRLAAAVPVFATSAVLLFLAFAFAPGDPLSGALGSAALLSSETQPSWGGDEGSAVRRLERILAAAADGEYGRSHRIDDELVVDLVQQRLAPTLILATAALLLAAPLGIGLGVTAAIARWSGWRALTALGFSAGLSVPGAALAAGLIYWLAVSWRLLPAAGWDGPWSAVIPVAVLAVPAAAHIGRIAGALAADVVPLAHVRTARAKGLSRPRAAWAHVLRNIGAPLTAAVATTFAGLLGGTLLVETLFAIPGLGREAVTATLARDFPVALGCTLALITINALAGLLADVAGALLDPRAVTDDDRQPAEGG